MTPRVVFCDNHCLGVIKPWNMLTQGDRTGDPSLVDWAVAWLKSETGKPGSVYLGLLHRLDRPAAGLVLLARTSKAASRLSKQFRTRSVEKRYLVVVHGIPEREGLLVHYLKKDVIRNRVSCVDRNAGGKEARLQLRSEGCSDGFSLLSVDLETGRPHQIRAQLAQIGHPVLGDIKYGAVRPLRKRNIALYSHRLIFEHPVRREPVRLESWPPLDEFPWNRFRLADAKLDNSLENGCRPWPCGSE